MTDLRRHVPPIALAWDDETPGELWRVVDGTLVFADVSGFTALTEKLSRRGRIGAEEIVETLNRVFGPMLRIAGTRGGELLKFGGDALLFLFRGRGPHRAGVRRRGRDAHGAAPGRGRAHVGRAALAEDVGRAALRGHPPVPRRCARPASCSSSGRARRPPPWPRRPRRPARSWSAPRPRPGWPADAVRPREDGELLLRRRSAHSAPGDEFVLPDVDRERIRGLFPHRAGGVPRPGHPRPGAPDRQHRVHQVLRHRRAAGRARARMSWPRRCTGPSAWSRRRWRPSRSACWPPTSTATAASSSSARASRPPSRTTRAGCCAPCAGSPTRTRRCRCSWASTAGTCSPPRSGSPSAAPTPGMGDTTNTAARIMSKAPAGVLFAHPAVLEHSRTRFAVTAGRAVPDEGQGRPAAGLRGRRGARDARRRRPPSRGCRSWAATRRSRPFGRPSIDGAGGRRWRHHHHRRHRHGQVPPGLRGARGDHRTRRSSWSGPSPTAPPAPTASSATRSGACSGSSGTPRRRWARPCSRPWAGSRRTCCPMAPLLADVVQVDVPSTPEVDQLDPQYRPDRLADAVVRLVDEAMPGPLVLRRRGGALGGRRVRAPAGPDRCRQRRAALGRDRGASRRGGRLRPGHRHAR